MPQLLLVADLVVSILILSAVAFARVRGNKQIWKRFWMGFCIGLVWELGFFFQGPLFSSHPIYHLRSAFPIHPALQPVAHAVWDGGLFVVGVLIVDSLCRSPTFERFRWAELLVFLLWVNLQEVVVELIAISTGLWTFIAGPYNLYLFSFENGAITLLPQLVWTIGTIGYYLALLRVNYRTVDER